MSLFLVNASLILLILTGLLLALQGIRWLQVKMGLYVLHSPGKLQRLLHQASFSEHLQGMSANAGPERDYHVMRAAELRQVAGAAFLKRMERLFLFFRVLNLTTTIAALVPLGFTIYNIVIDNQTQAFSFNLISLAAVLVTKGGLFLLTLVLIPMLKAVPAGMGTTFGGIIAHKIWKRVEAQRKPKPGE